MAYSALGYSLPDLTATGFAGPSASYGGTLSVTIDARNLGNTSIVDPLALQPGARSTSDAGPFDVQVFITRSRRFDSRAVPIGTVRFDGLPQNGLFRETASLTLPARPPGFPAPGGRFYVAFSVDPTNATNENDETNNITVSRQPVQISPNLPDLYAVGLDLPPALHPGDTIQPNIRIQNLGPAATSAQGPVVVALVASTSKFAGAGASVVASYTLNNIPGLSAAPTKDLVVGDANLSPPANTATIAGLPVTLPTSPGTYYLGVIVDPQNKIQQIKQIRRGPTNELMLVRRVGPPVRGLPPAGVIANASSTPNPFPVPPYGVINQNLPAPGVVATGTTTGTATGTTTGTPTGTTTTG